ncbi:MAG: Eco57I restriction-modification methylase domain-containing protein [Bacteroidota bacterium]|nr:Eco57I restriction-modification methylase domain-containing protein [Bacteroidota bacterium]
MAANRIQIQNALHKPYDRLLFSKEVLSSVFGSAFSLSSGLIEASVKPNQSESKVIDKVYVYGKIELEDGTEITCYEVLLQPTVRIEQSKVAIQRYVRKLLTSGQAALVNFITPINRNVWRLTLVAKDSELTESGVKEKTTHAKRYTFLLGPNESCKTAAERFEILSTEPKLDFNSLVKAFSVEILSSAFFIEYTSHYNNFVEALTKSNFKRSAFKGDEKAIRDFTKKLLGRIVFLYFVQKKGWLGASNKDYKDGVTDFMMKLFETSGANDVFYSEWLTVLFFETLNKERKDDDFVMPNGKKVKIPFLNGGLFDKEEHDEHLLTFKSILFHNPDNPDDPKHRGFLDFLNSFNFTVHEDSPDDHTVAVDPEMLGHIFENLLEDNADKGAFYTPKEIVHYMCQQSLMEYLTTHLSKEFTVYQHLDNDQIELFGNEDRIGQLKMIEKLGDKALNREDVEYIVKFKDISKLTKAQLRRMDELLNAVKICDPAIGSGAFPMGLLQEIYSIKEVIAYETNIDWKPSSVKENIIQNSIYGVDIEKGAVDIARLRFWLSLVVEESKPKPLPNLDYKIVVGDSLVSRFEDEIIEIDWEVKDGTQGNIFGNENVLKRKELLKTISTKQENYFQPENKNKKELAEEIRKLKIDILINQFELMVNTKGIEKQPTANGKKLKEQTEIYLQTKGWKKIISELTALKGKKDKYFNHFDWKLDFPEILNPYLVNENGGFDIVIANPPYIDSETMVSTGHEDLRNFLTKKLTFCKGNWDIYIAFFDIGYHFLKPTGNLVFITPDKWISKPFGYELRKGLLSKYITIAEAGRKVFQTAKVDSIITFIGKYDNESINIDKFKDNDIIHLDKVNKKGLSEPYAFDWLFSDYVSLLKQIDDQPNKLMDYGVCENACATSDAYKLKEYILDLGNKTFQPVKHLKMVNTGTVGKYSSKWGVSEMTYLKDKKNLEIKYKYLNPVVKIDEFEAAFKNSYSAKSIKPKIIIKGLTLLDASIDVEGQVIPGKSTLVITKPKGKEDELYFLLAFINSRLPFFYIKEKYRGSSYNQGVNFNIDMINNLPIKDLTKETMSVFKIFAEYLIYLNHDGSLPVNPYTDNHAISKVFEDVVNMMVYELYFEEHMKEENIDVMKLIDTKKIFKDISYMKTQEDISKTIGAAYKTLEDQENEIRNRIILSNVRSKNIIRLINSSSN